MSAPAVSIAMPVRNAMPYLGESVQCILDQTMSDFEFVILDDGSTDGSTELLQASAGSDSRIRLIEQTGRHPLEASLNSLVAATTAPLVARMDADDVSLPERLERQLEVIRQEDDVVLVGTLADGIDSGGRQVRPRDRWRLIRCSQVPFPGASVMFRRRTFDEVGGYRPGTAPGEDVELILRLGDRGRLLVLPDLLYRYRYHLGGATLACSPGHAERMAHLLDRALAEGRAARDQTPALDLGADAPPPPRVVAAAHHARGGQRLWAGHPPRALGDLIRGGALSWRPAAVRTQLWATWGAVSPASLRSALRTLVRARDLGASAWIRDGRPRDWRLR